jgi:hypothetical protein
VYNAATWRLGRPATIFNFFDYRILAEAKFVTGVSTNHVGVEQRRSHR